MTTSQAKGGGRVNLKPMRQKGRFHVLESGRRVGHVAVRGVDNSVDIKINERDRGRGLGSRALLALRDLWPKGLTAQTRKSNVAAARALEKAGFVKDGTSQNGQPKFRASASSKPAKGRNKQEH